MTESMGEQQARAAEAWNPCFFDRVALAALVGALEHADFLCHAREREWVVRVVVGGVIGRMNMTDQFVVVVFHKSVLAPRNLYRGVGY